jgi:hypothetical protein
MDSQPIRRPIHRRQYVLAAAAVLMSLGNIVAHRADGFPWDWKDTLSLLVAVSLLLFFSAAWFRAIINVKRLQNRDYRH